MTKMSIIKRVLEYKIFVFLFCMVVIVLQFNKAGYHYPAADEVGYIRIVNTLNQTGVFTNGGIDGDITGEKAGAFFAPAYPYFLSTISAFDEEVTKTFGCMAKQSEGCDVEGLRSVIWVQLFLGGVAATLVFYTILLLFDHRGIAWLALIIVLLGKTHSEYARHILTENLAFFFFYLLGFLLVLAMHSNTKRSWVLVGLSLGFAALARPTYYYLAFFMPFVVFAWHYWGKEKRDIKSGLYACVIFFASVFLVVCPWMVRNYYEVGQFSLTNGYASFILVQRIAYNMMSWAEWGVSFIYWLPDFGDSVAARLFDPSLYERLAWYNENSFYIVGNTSFRTETIALAGGVDSHFSYLLQNYILGDLFKHIMVTFPLVLRGMWAGKYIGLFGFIFLLPVCYYLAKNQKIGRFLVFLFPGVFILGLNGFVSVNVIRYNEPLVLVFAACIATVLWETGKWVQEKYKRAKS